MKVLIRDGKAVREAGDALKQTTEFIAIEADTERYSITPTTFETREYEKDLDSWFFIEEYRCGSGHATRVGLNYQAKDFMKQVTSDIKKDTFDVNGKPPSTIKSGKYSLDEAKSVKLCNLEEHLINKALEHLIKSGEKSIVIDIFVRMNGAPHNGLIKTDQGVPEVHSLVLYKNPTPLATPASSAASGGQTYLISVIDPSSFLFSSHLLGHKTSVNGVNFELSTWHKGFQIYKPGKTTLAAPEKDTGPRSEQFRDCIDIAIKIAERFNADPSTYDLTDIESTVPSCPVIVDISNQSKLSSSVLYQALPMRVKQTSDPILSQKFAEVLQILSRNLDKLASVLDDPTIIVAIRDACKKTLGPSDDNPLDIIKELCHHNGECARQFGIVSDAMVTEQKNLLGEVDSL